MLNLRHLNKYDRFLEKIERNKKTRINCLSSEQTTHNKCRDFIFILKNKFNKEISQINE